MRFDKAGILCAAVFVMCAISCMAQDVPANDKSDAYFRALTKARNEFEKKVFAKKKRGAISEGFTLRAEFVSVGSSISRPITLKLTLHNCSDQELYSWVNYPEAEYELHVVDQNGKVIPDIASRSLTYNKIGRIEPGATIVEMYQFDGFVSNPGVYNINAERPVYRLDGGGNGYVVSNTIQMTLKRSADSKEGLVAIVSTPAKNVTDNIQEPGKVPVKVPMVAVKPVLEKHGFTVTSSADGKEITASKPHSKVVTIRDGARVEYYVGYGGPARFQHGRLYAPGVALSILVAEYIQGMGDGTGVKE